jgi:Holliday junction DNA helicase RuvB
MPAATSVTLGLIFGILTYEGTWRWGHWAAVIILGFWGIVFLFGLARERKLQRQPRIKEIGRFQEESCVIPLDSPATATPIMPKSFSSFVGQSRVKTRLEMAIAAAKSRGDVPGHILLVGSPGSGKATLAQIIADAMGVNIKRVNGPVLTKGGELANLLTSVEKGDVFFIDDIHQVSRTISEYLYPAMKDFRLDVIIDQGLNQRSLRLNLPKFTLIGTAPRQERVHRELLSCFSIIETMIPYTSEEVVVIARQFADVLGLDINQTASARIAHSSDGTPLDILNRLRHVRDYAHVKGFLGEVTPEITADALEILPSTESASEGYNGRQAIPSEVRREVWRRDRGTCAKCGSRENLEYDHIIPITKGGSNTARNIELLCEVCNRLKRDSIL